MTRSRTSSSRLGGSRAPWAQSEPVLAVAGGVWWGLCFSRHPGALLPWLAFVPLVLLLASPRSARWAFVHGLVAWLVGISWLVPTLVVYGGLAWGVAAPLVLLLVAYLAAFSWLFAWLAGRLWRHGGRGALGAVPALWVALEWLRAHLFGGFPWNLAAYSWVEVPGALPLASFIGAYGVSFVVVAVATFVAHGLRRRRWEPALVGVSLALLLLSFGARFGGRTQEGPDPLPVRILQPDIENLVQWDPQAALDNYQRLLRMTEAACDVPGALVIWPESAAWPWAWQRDSHLVRDVRRLSQRCALLFNSPRWNGDPYDEDRPVFNSAYLARRGEVSSHYDKRHLVPWGEYVPLGDLLPFVGYLARNAAAFSPGDDPGLLSYGGERLGTAICFEVIFPAATAEQVRAGATILVTITNDAWYGDTFAPWQHLRAAQFRAAESGRPMLRAAITGISAFIDERGTLRRSLGVGEEGMLRIEVRGRHGTTLYSRAPWAVPLGCVALACALWLARQERLRAADRPVVE